MWWRKGLQAEVGEIERDQTMYGLLSCGQKFEFYSKHGEKPLEDFKHI